MRLIEKFSIAVIAAVGAMAFVGATSASATSTELCTAHTGLTCSSKANTVHLTLAEGQVGKLLSALATILCLNVLALGEPLALGSPQSIHGGFLTFENCGTNTSHTNCEVEVLTDPLTTLLKTGLDEGSLTTLNGLVFVVCVDVGGFIDIECEYDLTGLLFPVGAQHLTANKIPVHEFGPTILCPDNPRLDGLLKTLTNRYILG